MVPACFFPLPSPRLVLAQVGGFHMLLHVWLGELRAGARARRALAPCRGTSCSSVGWGVCVCAWVCGVVACLCVVRRVGCVCWRRGLGLRVVGCFFVVSWVCAGVLSASWLARAWVVALCRPGCFLSVSSSVARPWAAAFVRAGACLSCGFAPGAFFAVLCRSSLGGGLALAPLCGASSFPSSLSSLCCFRGGK